MTNLVQVESALHYSVQAPTSFLFNIAAAHHTPHQQILQESVVVDPETAYDLVAVPEVGNRIFRLLSQPGSLAIRYRAIVRLTPQFDQTQTLNELLHNELPDEVLPYLVPSRYCESDRLLKLAWDEFGDAPPGYERVSAICRWIREILTYTPGSTTAVTTACDVLVQRTGVCRDYTHLAIAICRALCIPARYVSGYAVGLEPPDFHGFFEAYLGSGWYLFDPTEMAPTTGLVRIGTGRDAADASFATIIGAATLDLMDVSARVLQPGEGSDGFEPPGVSTA